MHCHINNNKILNPVLDFVNLKITSQVKKMSHLRPIYLSKELCQYFIVYQLFVKALAHDFYCPEILLAEREQIHAVCLLINQVQARFGQFIKPVSFELSKKNALLNPYQAILFAHLGHFVPRFVFADVIEYPDKYRHTKIPLSPTTPVSFPLNPQGEG